MAGVKECLQKIADKREVFGEYTNGFKAYLNEKELTFKYICNIDIVFIYFMILF